jgi:hypothetical protein
VPRSGTTLLRLILDSSSLLAIPPETGFLLPLVSGAAPGEGEDARERLLSTILSFETWPDFHLSADDFRSSILALRPFSVSDGVRVFYRLYSQRFQKPRWGDKTPSYGLHIVEIERLLPEACFIHLIRDGRDVACSVRPLWFSPGTTIGEIARDWAARIVRIRSQASTCHRYLELRYEQLIREPEAAVRRVCLFLDLPFEPAMLRFHERAGLRLAEHEGRYHPDGTIALTREERLRQQVFAAQPPTPSRIGRWSRILSPEEVREFENAAGWLLRDLGYPREG